MTGDPMSRRGFLRWLATGAGLVGVVAWWRTTAGNEPIAPAATATPSAVGPPPTAATPTAAVPTTAASTSTMMQPVQTTVAASPQSIAVICRDAWGAAPPAGDFAPHRIEHLTVHHTAVLLEDNRNAPARVRQHQRYHLGKGWPDLAYHFIIDRNGNVYQGRPVESVGDTATGYDPTGHFLVCCEGDFNVEQPSPAQYRSLVTMLAWASSEFDADPGGIRGHRDLAATSCPGDHLYALVADGTIAEEVRVAGREPFALGLDLICDRAGADLVAAIEAGDA
jgi:hypothetical protein